ncbi:hypothetical protein PR048_007872 [Dryococelus australis]|uniref:Uncharacterized protein n=1 Tax=Dryococelus australis TaxID=614101 RepID=A0ABQ9HVV4_9NEOP|nr:hypothetical protein PR048_007872 [Dryococelus australis]
MQTSKRSELADMHLVYGEAHTAAEALCQLRCQSVLRDICTDTSKSSLPAVRSVGHGGLVVRLLAPHLGEPGSIHGGPAPGFSHVGIMPDDAAGRRVFSVTSILLTPFHSGVTPYLTKLQQDVGYVTPAIGQQLVRQASRTLLAYSKASTDKIDVKHVYTEVDFAIGLQFIRHALDDSEPIADLQRKQQRPYCQVSLYTWPFHLCHRTVLCAVTRPTSRGLKGRRETHTSCVGQEGSFCLPPRATGRVLNASERAVACRSLANPRSPGERRTAWESNAHLRCASPLLRKLVGACPDVTLDTGVKRKWTLNILNWCYYGHKGDHGQNKEIYTFIYDNFVRRRVSGANAANCDTLSEEAVAVFCHLYRSLQHRPAYFPEPQGKKKKRVLSLAFGCLATERRRPVNGLSGGCREESVRRGGWGNCSPHCSVAGGWFGSTIQGGVAPLPQTPSRGPSHPFTRVYCQLPSGVCEAGQPVKLWTLCAGVVELRPRRGVAVGSILDFPNSTLEAVVEVAAWRGRRTACRAPAEKCFARRGDARIDAHVSVALALPRFQASDVRNSFNQAATLNCPRGDTWSSISDNYVAYTLNSSRTRQQNSVIDQQNIGVLFANQRLATCSAAGRPQPIGNLSRHAAIPSQSDGRSVPRASLSQSDNSPSSKDDEFAAMKIFGTSASSLKILHSLLDVIMFVTLFSRGRPALQSISSLYYLVAALWGKKKDATIFHKSICSYRFGYSVDKPFKQGPWNKARLPCSRVISAMLLLTFTRNKNHAPVIVGRNTAEGGGGGWLNPSMRKRAILVLAPSLSPRGATSRGEVAIRVAFLSSVSFTRLLEARLQLFLDLSWIFACANRAGRYRYSEGVFSGIFLFPALSFRLCSILISLHSHRTIFRRPVRLSLAVGPCTETKCLTRLAVCLGLSVAIFK